MISGLRTIGLSSLTHQQEVVHAEMLTATNQYYFPVVIVPILVLCLRFNRGQQVRAASDIHVQLTLISH